MRIVDCDILIVPGLGGSEEAHWQSRWAGRMATARVVEQDDWHAPEPAAWRARVVEAVTAASRPVILIGHSLGVVACVAAAAEFPHGRVRGALFVALPDVEETPNLPGIVRAFAPLPRAPLPFPSLLVASRTDPYCDFARAETFASAWGATLVDAGESGHLNVASGHGPWPEGLMRLAGFMKDL